MVTKLADLAHQVGVSTATISRVLNGRDGVSEETRDKVLQALDAMGYERPYRLKKHSRGLIGIVVPNLEQPLFALFAQFISGALARHDLTPIICPQDAAGVSEDDYIDMLLDHHACGIIFIAGHHADQTSDPLRYQRLLSAALPIVLINGFTPAVNGYFISDDTEAGTEAALAHLISLGHRRIGLANGPVKFIPMARRHDRFVQMMTDTFGPGDYERDIETSLLTVEGGQAAATQLIDRGCTALLCGSDFMALGAIQAALRKGLSIPRDLSLIGYDDSVVMGFIQPALTTIRQSTLAMGQAAVSIMVSALSGIPSTAGQELLFRPELVVRMSTGRAPRRG
ncbi:MAG: LacI family transcriptional regulator [Propionibacteriaceae bacterium]|jgi:alanine racemase|nr:LacI family transcriptional regulator [Propionibacteriaceae bacterium]